MTGNDWSFQPGEFPPGVAVPEDYGQIPERLNMAEEALGRALSLGWGDRVAFVGPAGSLTYAELVQKVEAFATHAREMGIEPDDRVLLRLWNCFEFAIALLGLIRIGAIPVMQNTAAGTPDIEYVQEHSDAVAAVVLADLAEPLRPLANRFAKGVIVARGAQGKERPFEAMLSLAADQDAVEVHPSRADDMALMCYSSGTTGRPKGILHAHRWILGRGIPNWARVPPQVGDVVMASGEWSFISLLGHNVFFALRNGVTGAVLEGRASPEKVLQAVNDYRVTLLYAVPTIYRMILARPGLETPYDLSSLRGCNASGEALGAAALAEWRERVGVDIWEHYGVSEMQMVLGNSPLLPIKPGSAGVPWGVEARVIDDEDQVLPPGAVGQLVFRTRDNPSLFLGYHKDQDKTADVTRGGWYRTGDLARIDDDGYFWILGRNDDCFKSKGVFIAPTEIEAALQADSRIAEACVVPAPDGIGGTLIRAVLVARDASLSPDALAAELKESLKQKLARNKVPHRFDFVDALPKSSTHKVLRRELAAEVPSTVK